MTETVNISLTADQLTLITSAFDYRMDTDAQDMSATELRTAVRAEIALEQAAAKLARKMAKKEKAAS